MRNSTIQFVLLLTLVSTIDTSDLLWAEDYYVNNETGSDQRDGHVKSLNATASGPFRTIAKALQVANRGDRIILTKTKTPYQESITLQAIRHSGFPTRPFILEGNGAILNGSSPIPARDWKAFRDQENVFRYQPRFKSHHLLFIRGIPGDRIHIEANGGELPELKPLQSCLFRGYVYFRVEANKLPEDYQLSATSLPVGITLYEVRHVQIRNLVVQGFRLDGINAHDSVFDGSLLGLNCRGNGRSGISVGGASRVRIESCLVGNNGRGQLRTEGQSRTLVVNCDLIDDDPQAPAIVKTGGTVLTEK